MRHLPRILKTVLTTSAGLVLALYAAVPVGADDPPPAPGTGPFVASALGEDDCTIFFAGGQVRWSVTDPAPSTATVSGWRSLGEATATGPCTPGPVSDRQIEFTAYGAGTPLDERTVPFGPDDTGTSYGFTLSASTEIDTVTVAVCLERLPDGSTWPDRCGGSETIALDELPDEAPEGPSCEHSSSVTEQWNGGGLLSTEVQVDGNRCADAAIVR